MATITREGKGHRKQAAANGRPRQEYQTPSLHELGTLGKLQAVGFNWRDGRRYKDKRTYL